MDCLEGMKLLDDNSIDLIVTSPPYNKHRKNGGRLVKAVDYDEYVDDLDEEQYQKWQIDIINECYRILKDGGCFFYNHKNRYVDGKMISPIEWLTKTKFTIRQEIIWDKRIAANIRGWRFWTVDERIYWLQKGDFVEISPSVANKSSVWRIRPQEKSEYNHPCAFPVDVVENCISVIDKDNAIILDPFMGSGTTAIVAMRHNYDYIGFELSSNYCDIANQRIADEERVIKSKLF